jgi:hypothetical protein
MAQTQHDIRVVPANAEHRASRKNVPSGTCVDDPQLLPAHKMTVLPEVALKGPLGNPRKIFENITDNVGFDFLLTPHGGLKASDFDKYNRFYVFQGLSC